MKRLVSLPEETKEVISLHNNNILSSSGDNQEQTMINIDLILDLQNSNHKQCMGESGKSKFSSSARS